MDSDVDHHQQFLQHLDSLPSAAELLRVCKAYKTAPDNYAFELNGRLKGGLPMGTFALDLPFLQQVICASLAHPLTVYRMTSEYEFSAPTLQVVEGSFRYQAFMSTSDDVSRLGRFVPSSGRALLLEIECPPGIAFAPLDLFPGTADGEYLLGCGTAFQVLEPPRSLSGAEVRDYMPFSGPSNLVVMKLRASANPPYVRVANLLTLND